MTNLAQYLSTFFREYLPIERQLSPHTCETYSYTFQLLVNYSASRLKSAPAKLTIEQLDVDLIVDFLNHLESKRGNSARTRNARAAAIKSFFRFLEYRAVSFIEQSRQIHAIPVKKMDEKLVAHLSKIEMQAILKCPNCNTISGVRDRAMIHLCFAAGLRVSELVSLQMSQLELGDLPQIRITGKGRRERVLPLWKETVSAIKAWIVVKPEIMRTPELFLNARGQAMTRSGFEYILLKYVKIAELNQPSLIKKKVSPHVLRHSCAMITLQATHDIRKVSLWLGHASVKSTEKYLRSNPNEKLEILMGVSPMPLSQGRFSAPDKLLAMLRMKEKVE